MLQRYLPCIFSIITALPILAYHWIFDFNMEPLSVAAASAPCPGSFEPGPKDFEHSGYLAIHVHIQHGLYSAIYSIQHGLVV